MTKRDLNRVVMLGMMEHLDAVKATAFTLISYMDSKDVYTMIDAIQKARRVVGNMAVAENEREEAHNESKPK